MNALEASIPPTGLLAIDALAAFGGGLQRPECVLATRAGDVYCADVRGGVTQLRPDGGQRLFSGAGPDGLALKPNGIALLRDGAFLLAHLGDDEGGVFRLDRAGQVRPWLTTIDGIDMPPTNFVVEDFAGRFWVTVSTRLRPRALGYRRECSDGFIAVVDGRGARIVADGLGYTNEVAVDPGRRWLYVNETFARRLSRFALRSDGALGPREVVTEFGPGTFPDGLAFDEAGHAWVVSIVSNRVIRVAPDGAQTLWLEDADAGHLAHVEAAFAAGTMGREHLAQVKSGRLRNISSIAFSGADRRTALLGCLLGDRLFAFNAPAAGAEPAHWHYPLAA